MNNGRRHSNIPYLLIRLQLNNASSESSSIIRFLDITSFGPFSLASKFDAISLCSLIASITPYATNVSTEDGAHHDKEAIPLPWKIYNISNIKMRISFCLECLES